MQTREEWLARYEAWKSEPKYIHKITTDEYRRFVELSQFVCPIGREIRDCAGHPCPTRPEDIWEDYFWECVKSRNARNQLMSIRDGTTKIEEDVNEGWELRLEQ